MNTPSNELHAISAASKPDVEALLIEWGKLLGKLKIVNGPFAYSDSLARAVGFTHDDGAEDDIIFELHLYSTTDEFFSGGYLQGDFMTAKFFVNNSARIKRSAKFLGEPCGLEGTWEEVARKLFELEKLMLAQIPEVPGDLKS